MENKFPQDVWWDVDYFDEYVDEHVGKITVDGLNWTFLNNFEVIGGALDNRALDDSSLTYTPTITLGDTVLDESTFKELLDLLDFIKQHPDLGTDFNIHTAWRKLQDD